MEEIADEEYLLRTILGGTFGEPGQAASKKYDVPKPDPFFIID
jgi:hypothetical protein